MTEELVTLETAMLAKEKGFDEDLIARPTQDLLERWLREVHHLWLEIDTFIIGDNWKTGFIFHRVQRINSNLEDGPEIRDSYETYELAREAALQHALKLLPNAN